MNVTCKFLFQAAVNFVPKVMLYLLDNHTETRKIKTPLGPGQYKLVRVLNTHSDQQGQAKKVS